MVLRGNVLMMFSTEQKTSDTVRNRVIVLSRLNPLTPLL